MKSNEAASKQKGKKKGKKEVLANEVDEKVVEESEEVVDGVIKNMLPENWAAEINGMKPIDQQFVEGDFPIGQVFLLIF